MRREHATWWCLDLGDGVLAVEPCHQIQEQFDRMHAERGRPATMAVFTARVEGDLHCRVMAYFPPACAELALQLGSVPCAVPARAALELLAGAAASWQQLFPSVEG